MPGLINRPYQGTGFTEERSLYGSKTALGMSVARLWRVDDMHKLLDVRLSHISVSLI